MNCAVCDIPLEEDEREISVSPRLNQTIKTGYLVCTSCGLIHIKLQQCDTCAHYKYIHRDDYVCFMKKEEVKADYCCNAYEEATD